MDVEFSGDVGVALCVDGAAHDHELFEFLGRSGSMLSATARLVSGPIAASVNSPGFSLASQQGHEQHARMHVFLR